MDENQMLEAIALKHGFALFEFYEEKQAAQILRINLGTLKRWRRDRKLDHSPMGERKHRYLGRHLALMILKGVPCQDTQSETSNAANTGFPSNGEAPRGAAHGTTLKPDKPDAYPLAQSMFRKQSKS